MVNLIKYIDNFTHYSIVFYEDVLLNLILFGCYVLLHLNYAAILMYLVANMYADIFAKLLLLKYNSMPIPPIYKVCRRNIIMIRFDIS